MDEIKISVLITTYNGEKYIKECIQSILNQTYHNFEIIVIDDGSKDNTKNIISEFEDDRIKYYYEENSGVSVARNNAKQKASGQYVIYVDCDDTIINTMLEELVKLIKREKPDLILFECNRVFEKDGNIKIESTSLNDGKIKIYSKEEACKGYIYGNKEMTFIIWRKCYKKEILDKVDFPEGMIPEDMATGFDFLYAADKIAYYRRNLYHYRMLPNGLTMVRTLKRENDMLDMYQNDFIKEIKAYPECKKKIISKYFNSLILSSYYIKQIGTKEAKESSRRCKKELENFKFKDLNTKSKMIYIVYMISENLLYKMIKKRATREERKRN